jgi:hypothetical protein
VVTSISGVGASASWAQFAMPSTAASSPNSVPLTTSQVLQNAKTQQVGSLLSASGAPASTTTTDPTSYAQAALFDMFAQNPAMAALLAGGKMPSAASGTAAGTSPASGSSDAALPAQNDPFAAAPDDGITDTYDPFAGDSVASSAPDPASDNVDPGQ